MVNWKKKKKALPSWSLLPTGEKTDNTQNIRIHMVISIWKEKMKTSKCVCVCVHVCMWVCKSNLRECGLAMSENLNMEESEPSEGKRFPGRETSKCKGPEVAIPRVLQEEQGGEHRWSKVFKKAGSRESLRVYVAGLCVGSCLCCKETSSILRGLGALRGSPQ